MIHPAATAALLGLLLAAGPTHGATTGSAPEVALKRVNLLVADMERSLAIYRDILGFRVFQCGESGAQAFDYRVFRLPSQAQLRFCTLDSSAEVRALALVEVRGIELPAQPPLHLSAPLVRIEHLETVLAALRAAELDVLEPRRSQTAEGRGLTELAFTDPDGHRIVLYQLD